MIARAASLEEYRDWVRQARLEAEELEQAAEFDEGAEAPAFAASLRARLQELEAALANGGYRFGAEAPDFRPLLAAQDTDALPFRQLLQRIQATHDDGLDEGGGAADAAEPAAGAAPALRLETLAVHAGYAPEATTRAVAVPVYQTTSYAFDDTAHGAALFNLEQEGNIYTRIMNPTTAVLEQRVAALEGGAGALALSSGMAAITNTVFTLADSGDNIVSASALYGGTYNLFEHALPRLGIETRFADPDDLDALAARIDARTRLLFCETIGNPAGGIADLAALAELAHAHGLPLVVDNTVPTPVLCRPIEHGADLIVHSLTKYMGGHGTTIGGVVVDSGAFPWAEHPARFPMLSEPDPSYHGVVYTELPVPCITRMRTVPLRNMGAALSPFNSFLVLQGLETLPLRMARHCENAQAAAEFLQAHPAVEWVRYAGLPDHPHHGRTRTYLDGRASSILSFGIRGGRAAGARFIDALQLVVRLVNIGDAKSLACHPASTTHRQLDAAGLAAAGVRDDLVRLSVGIEHIDDIRADLDQALAAAAA